MLVTVESTSIPAALMTVIVRVSRFILAAISLYVVGTVIASPSVAVTFPERISFRRIPERFILPSDISDVKRFWAASYFSDG